MDQIVSKEIALRAREIGFDEWRERSYMKDVKDSLSISGNNSTLGKLEIETFSAPTQTSLAKWLREKHDLYVHVDCNASGWLWEIEKTNGTSVCWCNYSGPNLSGQWDTFEEALEDGLKNICEIVKQRNR